MASEATLLIEVWDAVRDHLPVSKRGDVAGHLLRAFGDYGFELADLAGALDEDPDLSAAADEVYGDGDERGDDEEG